MMRPNPSAAATPRKSHASRTPCGNRKCCPHGARDACVLQAAVASNGRFKRIIVQLLQNATPGCG
eukprot:6527092-Lingulodinium_polyedra.AAC.1